MRPANLTIDELRGLDSDGAVARPAALPDTTVAGLLGEIGPSRAVAILDRFGPERRRQMAIAAGLGKNGQWLTAQNWPAETVGRLMGPAPAVFAPDATVAEVIEKLRSILSHTLVTYVFVVDGEQYLTGLVAFRELACAQPSQRLSEIMVTRPFALRPDTLVIEAMREVVHRHYPAYPVCDGEGHLIGVVRGAELFEEQAFEISAQAGAMVGVDEISRVVDYEKIADRARTIVATGHTRLVETLAERIAASCLANVRVLSVRVRVEKLDVFADAASAGVEIERRR